MVKNARSKEKKVVKPSTALKKLKVQTDAENPVGIFKKKNKFILKKEHTTFVIDYQPGNDQSKELIREERFRKFLEDHQELLINAARESFSEKDAEDPILIVFDWNDDGLNDRLGYASANPPGGSIPRMVTAGGDAVANAQDMRNFIAGFLTTGPDAGTNLGGHSHIFQFMTNQGRDRKMDALLAINHPFLRRRGDSALNLPVNAINWRDIVNYCQTINITRANAAVGPVDIALYFNA